MVHIITTVTSRANLCQMWNQLCWEIFTKCLYICKPTKNGTQVAMMMISFAKFYKYIPRTKVLSVTINIFTQLPLQCTDFYPKKETTFTDTCLNTHITIQRDSFLHCLSYSETTVTVRRKISWGLTFNRGNVHSVQDSGSLGHRHIYFYSYSSLIAIFTISQGILTWKNRNKRWIIYIYQIKDTMVNSSVVFFSNIHLWVCTWQ
jgi:hypothetical protein